MKVKFIFAMIVIVAIVIVYFVFIAPEKESEMRKYFIEQVGDIAFARVYADGFEELSLNDRLLAYYLTQAAIAGDPIEYDQLHRDAPRIKRLLEMIITHAEDIDSDIYAKILNYTKLFWANGSQYSNRNKNKFIPEFTYEELKEAAVKAKVNGADFGLKGGETVHSLLEGLRKSIFDENYEPLITAKDPPKGQDIITASANNLYHDVTLKEVEAFYEKYPLNSRLARTGGHIVEEVYRMGDGTDVPAGRYAEYIRNIIKNLRLALDYASTDQSNTIQKLIRYFETGAQKDWYAFNIAWVDDSFPVDFINGFIESYVDARSIKATYESFVFYVDKKTTVMMNALAEKAPYFEKNAPWDDKYKKVEFVLPRAISINILTATGDGGPQCPLGINLPNEQDLREKYGSKSVLLTNALEAYDQAVASKTIDEFAYSTGEAERAIKYGREADSVKIALHEIVGHGSGKMNPKLKKDPSTYLKEYYSTLEEARAELMALWNIADSELVDMGLLSDEEAALAEYESYARNGLIQLRRIKTGDVIEDDHMRAINLIVNYLKEKGSIEIKEKDQKFYYVLHDMDDMHEQVGELLAEVMRIKAEGDYDGAKSLVEKYAVKINTAIRDQVVRRCRDIRYPDFTALVMPRMKPVKDESGKIIDVVIKYDDDIKSQMLRWSEHIDYKEPVEEK